MVKGSRATRTYVHWHRVRKLGVSIYGMTGIVLDEVGNSAELAQALAQHKVLAFPLKLGTLDPPPRPATRPT